MEEKELIELVRSQPEYGYTLLIQEYSNLVYAIAWNKLKLVASKEDVEDCVSEIFVSIYQSFDRFDESRYDLKSFISMVAKRVSISQWRKKSRLDRFVQPMEEDLSQGMGSLEVILEKEEKKQLWNMVRNLGEPDTSILVWKYFYAESVEVIAKKLMMTKSAVYKRSRRALKKLKNQLEEER